MEKKSIEKFAVISMDVEEWFHLEYFKDSEVDYSNSTLDGLDNFIKIIESRNISATFFVVGELIDKLKNKLIKLERKGHELAIHSFKHIRPTQQSIEDFKNDTKKCIIDLKKISENKFFGYRAPCFSLDRERLDCLIELDLLYDSSKINQKDHPLYTELKIDDFKTKIRKGVYEKNNFLEFEISTINILGKNIPISGGGYLRIIPWPIYKFLLKRYLKKNKFFNFYIHPFELSNSNFILPRDSSFLNRIRYKWNRRKVALRIKKIIDILKKENYKFITYSEII
tara:strand:+ start:200 stop:1048 length:849 start_codon:yes stop_codon:yes gene_type:complete